MKKLVLILFLFGNIHVAAQKKIVDSTKTPSIHFSLPDTLVLNSIKSDSLNTPPLEKNMPWIVALLIGVLSVIANIIVANRLNITNEKNLLKQIDNSKEVTLTQFKATVGTKNRQEWINEIRHNLSDMLANGALVTAEFQAKDSSKEVIYKYTERVIYCRSKIQMLLNDQKPEQKRVLDAVQLFTEANRIATKENPNADKIRTARSEILESARALFKLHWQKIKNLE